MKSQVQTMIVIFAILLGCVGCHHEATQETEIKRATLNPEVEKDPRRETLNLGMELSEMAKGYYRMEGKWPATGEDLKTFNKRYDPNYWNEQDWSRIESLAVRTLDTGELEIQSTLHLQNGKIADSVVTVPPPPPSIK